MPTDLPPDWIPEEERQRRAALVTSGRAVLSAVNWLYWVAGITVVNALVTLFGPKKGRMSLGLGVSRLADDLFAWMGMGSPIFTLVTAVLLAAFIVALGMLGKRNTWALVVAILLILVDTVLLFTLNMVTTLGILFRFWVAGALLNGLVSLQRIKASVPAS